jgi:hypothetical protein
MILQTEEDDDWWQALLEEVKREKLAGGDGRLIPLPSYPITQSEWSGDDDGVNENHLYLYDSVMREF